MEKQLLDNKLDKAIKFNIHNKWDIEYGRYKSISRDQWLRKVCKLNDEYHFFLNCQHTLSF